MGPARTGGIRRIGDNIDMPMKGPEPCPIFRNRVTFGTPHTEGAATLTLIELGQHCFGISQRQSGMAGILGNLRLGAMGEMIAGRTVSQLANAFKMPPLFMSDDTVSTAQNSCRLRFTECICL